MIATYPVMHAQARERPRAALRRLAGKVFSRSADDHGVATVEIGPDGPGARGGRHGLMLLKTSGSAFTHFARDEYTTPPERGDRPLFVRIDADWLYADDPGRPVDSLAVRDHLARFDDFVSSRSSTSSTRWARGCWPTTTSSPRSPSAENHARPGRRAGRPQGLHRPFPARA